MGLMTGQHPHIPYPTPTSMPIDTLVAQPAGAPAIYPLGYDARLLGQASAYPPRLSVADLYGAAAAAYPDPTAASAGYIAGLPPGHPAAMLYPTALTGGYDLKDPRATWAALPQAAGYHCDPALAAYGPYGDRYDPLDSEARRRNATRETTSTLKAWLNEHRKNPYPTKGEKIMLAIITKMTLTQVSTWFANARRRLKKENKMTWEPRNKTADDLDDVSIDEDEGKKDDDEEDRESKTDEEKDSGAEDRPDKGSSSQSDLGVIQSHRTSQQDPKSTSTDHSTETSSSLVSIEKTSDKDRLSSGSPSGPLKDTDSAPSEKPKIWSLAHTATSTSPPSVRRNWPASNFVGSDEFDNHLRMNRLLFHDRLTSRDLCSLPVFHPGRTETATDLRTKLSHDVSESSSLSSPPLWRTSADSLLNAEKFGRLTPLDGNDLRSLSSSSSSGSPAVVSSNFEASSSAPPSLSYSPARYFGSRLVQSHESVRTSGTTDFGARSPVTVFTTDRYPNHSPSILASTGGSIPSPFVRTSPFSCPSSFGHTPASQTTTELRR